MDLFKDPFNFPYRGVVAGRIVGVVWNFFFFLERFFGKLLESFGREL